ncbi:MAG TPA: L,D-transpeptidase, partial [Agitococcus sp.]|nr:L,D-transpeptidase [Agitococcus sp.]HNH44061.1 L,D-transpeptidase [Agitococcus sp.]
VWQQQQIIAQFIISSALKGAGEIQGSEQTPRGQHIIRAKIGQNQPINSVFKARRPTGEIYNAQLAAQFPTRDWILTRIMWLSGCELGKNRGGRYDTMRRYIYIHGTPDTEPMGIPKSHGCIRMRNEDIIQLFDLVPVYTPVIIHE